MKKSIYSKWHVKLVIVVFCILAVYLVVDAYQAGVKEVEKTTGSPTTY